MMGLDWGKIRQEYAEKATPSELNSVTVLSDGREIPTALVSKVPKGPKKASRRTYRPGSRDGVGGAARRYDYDKLEKMYVEDRMTIPEIAAVLGCHRKTVYDALDRLGIPRRDDRERLPGRPKREVCDNFGHPMTDGHPNVRVDAKGQRHCRGCERERGVRRRRSARERG